MSKRLGVGIVGCGFIANFHAQSWLGVRDADIVALCSRSEDSAFGLGEKCRKLGIGEPEIYTDLKEFARDPDMEAVWVAVPNDARISVLEVLAEEVEAGRSGLKAVAVEKPLGRNISEAGQLVKIVEDAGLLHGYLENQVFAPEVVKGKEIIWRRGASIAGSPYLARAAEEHGGPHEPWFWIGSRQGGGVLSDMMCHSIEACRYMLTPPDSPDSLKPVSVTATTACLKWSREEYIKKLKNDFGSEVDYKASPAEDYASCEVVFESPDQELVIAQANTSWSFSGAGLRLSFELLGPEYSLTINSLDPGSRVFFSRNIEGPEGEDLVEKQAAEQGEMPYLGDEAKVYGYTDENRHMVSSFSKGLEPRETLDDGLLVIQLLMTAYRSAELGKTIEFKPDKLKDYVPPVARDEWEARSLLDRVHRIKN